MARLIDSAIRLAFIRYSFVAAFPGMLRSSLRKQLGRKRTRFGAWFEAFTTAEGGTAAVHVAPRAGPQLGDHASSKIACQIVSEKTQRFSRAWARRGLPGRRHETSPRKYRA